MRLAMTNDERLLIASHIKPWAVCTEKEKTAPKNGFTLSPLYDRLFDRGLITFTDDKRVVVSNWLNPADKNRIGIKDGEYVQMLPLDDARTKYLEYHRELVFKH